MTHSTKDPSELRRELHRLHREEKDLQRRIGDALLAGEDVSELRARRREVREKQEDLAAACTRAQMLEDSRARPVETARAREPGVETATRKEEIR